MSRLTLGVKTLSSRKVFGESAATARAAGEMNDDVLGPDEATNVDLAESRHKRNQAHVACFLHLRDLVYLHPEAASASAVSFVQKLEAAVIAEKAARQKRLAEARAREAAWSRGGSTESGDRNGRIPPHSLRRGRGGGDP